MPKQQIHAADAPGAIGPYSQAIVVGGLVFCSGQVALEPVTGQLIAGDIAEQTRRALDNLGAVLRAAGSSLQNAVKTTVYLANFGDFAAMNEAYAAYFGDTPPARSTIGVSTLPKNALIEIDCIATLT